MQLDRLHRVLIVHKRWLTVCVDHLLLASGRGEATVHELHVSASGRRKLLVESHLLIVLAVWHEVVACLLLLNMQLLLRILWVFAVLARLLILVAVGVRFLFHLNISCSTVFVEDLVSLALHHELLIVRLLLLIVRLVMRMLLVSLIFGPSLVFLLVVLRSSCCHVSRGSTSLSHLQRGAMWINHHCFLLLLIKHGLLVHHELVLVSDDGYVAVTFDVLILRLLVLRRSLLK